MTTVTTEWIANPVYDGKATVWTSLTLPGWFIYDQPAGFYAWHGFKFHAEFADLTEAQAHCARTDRQNKLERLLTRYAQLEADLSGIATDPGHDREREDACNDEAWNVLRAIVKVLIDHTES
jgi:hypothetical protein